MKEVHFRFYQGSSPTPGRLPEYVAGIFDGDHAFDVVDCEDRRWLGCPLLVEGALSRQIPLGVPVQLACLQAEENGFTPGEVIWWKAQAEPPHLRVVLADSPFPVWRGAPMSFLELFTWEETEPVEALRRTWREVAASRQGTPRPSPGEI